MRAWREEAAEITAAERQSLHLLWCGSALASDKSYIICALQASGQGWALSPLTRSISPRLNQRLPWSKLTGSPQVPDKLLTTRHHPALQTHIPPLQRHTHTALQASHKWPQLRNVSSLRCKIMFMRCRDAQCCWLIFYNSKALTGVSTIIQLMF